MEVTSGFSVAVTEETQVSEARRRGISVAAAVGLGEQARSRVALIVTEMATNLVKHGGGGEVFIGPATSGANFGIQVVGFDKGRGIPNVPASLADGFSTAGSPGTGLGAIQRAANTFDIYSRPDQGTVVAATVFAHAAAEPLAAGISVPIQGEIDCGDGWAVWSAGKLSSVFLCDGLGHGTDAARATQQGIAAFRRHAERPAADVIKFVHDALKPTRGAAIAIAALDQREGRLVFCGLGNIAGRVIKADGTTQNMVSHNGIAGHTMRRIQEFTYPCPAGSIVVLHSDGIATGWGLTRYAGVEQHRPDVIAGLLYRDFRRGRDDATVVVARNVVAA